MVKQQHGQAADVNVRAAQQVATVTGTRIPKASELTDDAGLLAKYQAAKDKELARHPKRRN